MARAFLGIDVGGTASRWAVVDDAGEVVARGSAAGATGHLFNPAERERFAKTIDEIRSGIATSIAAAHAGVTGLGNKAAPEAHAIIAEAFGIAVDAISSSDDMELAFRATFRLGQGHLVSAGTGSIGLHITAEGDVIRVGGRGILIDDGGSGSWIALTAIDRLYRRIDETGTPADASILAEHIYEAVGGPAWDDVRSFIYGSDRGRIGTLARAVAEAATRGDALATEILDNAVGELARLADALAARTRSLPVAFVGGVVDLHPMIKNGLVERLAGTSVGFPRIDAALHAAQMARQRTTER